MIVLYTSQTLKWDRSIDQSDGIKVSTIVFCTLRSDSLFPEIMMCCPSYLTKETEVLSFPLYFHQVHLRCIQSPKIVSTVQELHPQRVKIVPRRSFEWVENGTSFCNGNDMFVVTFLSRSIFDNVLHIPLKYHLTRIVYNDLEPRKDFFFKLLYKKKKAKHTSHK